MAASSETSPSHLPIWSAKDAWFDTTLQEPHPSSRKDPSAISLASHATATSVEATQETPQLTRPVPFSGAFADPIGDPNWRHSSRHRGSRRQARLRNHLRRSGRVGGTFAAESSPTSTRDARRARLASLVPVLMPASNYGDGTPSPESDRSTPPGASSTASPDPSTINPIRVRGAGGRNGPRSRNGCWTCRVKKVKCDETRPRCLRCIRLRLFCDYEPRDKQARSDGSSGETSNAVTSASAKRRLLTTQPWLLQLAPWRSAATIPAQLPLFDTAANSLKLTSLDHEAIRYYRTTFSSRHSTKNADFSVYSVIYTLAERDPLVMRGLLALGTRNMLVNSPASRDEDNSTTGWTGLDHYSATLRMMADTISAQEANKIHYDIDVALAAIYLMLLYEQKYGDTSYSGWVNHLRGAALVIKQHCHDWPAQLKKPPGAQKAFQPPPEETSLVLRTQTAAPLTMFAARIIIHLTIMDGFGSTFGIGGDVNKAMYEIVLAHDPDVILTEAFTKLHRYSDGIYRAVWRADYPAEEMISDVANQNIGDMSQASCSLRYLVTEIAELEGDAARHRLAVVQEATDHLAEKYPELVALALELTPETELPEMIATPFRAYMPLYFSSLLELHLQKCRLYPEAYTAEEEAKIRSSYIDVIMVLSQQAFKTVGLEILHLVSYPLFLSAIHTESHAYRTWILARFEDMMTYGPNIQRIHRFLTMAIKKQEETGERVDVRKEFESPEVERFVV